MQVSKYDDPQEAAIAVVVEAYRLWLQYEVRTDDITIIVARVEGLQESATLTNIQSMRCGLDQVSRSKTYCFECLLHLMHAAQLKGGRCVWLRGVSLSSAY